MAQNGNLRIRNLNSKMKKSLSLDFTNYILSQMQKYITKKRVFQSSSEQKPSIITVEKSLSKLKGKINLSYRPYETLSYNEKVKQEYMVRNNQKMSNNEIYYPKTIYHQKREKESLDITNRSIKFENQLWDEIKNLNMTLAECKQLQKELVRQKTFLNASQIVQQNPTKNHSLIEQNQFIPSNLKQLAYLQQRIRNREKQINSVTQNIASLKQDDCKLNQKKIPLQQKLLPSSNINKNRIILADQLSELNLQLKKTITEYKKKYHDLKAMKTTIKNAYKDGIRFYQLRVRKSQQSKALLLEKPITYTQFKQILHNKKKQSQNSKNKDLHRIKSLQILLPSNINQFSNISNVSAILPHKFFDQWVNRQLLPGQIPLLPKQNNPTIKSMNLKKNVLKQAIETQKDKHQKRMAQLIDKLLFLNDEDAFLTEKLESHQSQISGLQAKFSYIEMKIKQSTTVSKKLIPNKKTKILQEETFMHFVGGNHSKKSLQEDYLLDNTGNNSFILEHTSKITKFS